MTAAVFETNPKLQAFVEAMHEKVQERADRFGTFPMDGGDWYSALHRPGAWEWPYGERLRKQLMADGWGPVPDPVCSWRVLWLKTFADRVQLERLLGRRR